MILFWDSASVSRRPINEFCLRIVVSFRLHADVTECRWFELGIGVGVNCKRMIVVVCIV